MTEQIHPVEVSEVEYICPSCHTGRMLPSGLALMSNPPLYPHVCPNCNTTLNLQHRYPRLLYRRISL